MSLIRPVPVWMPTQELAAEVVTPPLGGMTVEELSELSAASPHSFIRVAAAGIDSKEGGPPPTTHPASAANPAAGSTRLAEMIVDGIFERIEGRQFFVYEVLSGSHRAVGLVCEVDVAGYSDGRVLRHEATRTATEDLLVGFLDVLQVHADPVALAYRHDGILERLIEDVMTEEPLRQFSTTMPTPGATGDERICHQRVWVVPDDGAREVRRRLEAVDRLYITDGHHRLAAAASSSRALQSGVGVLAVLYADDALTVLPFDRAVISDMLPMEIAARIAHRVDDFRLLEFGAKWAPKQRGEVTAVIGGVPYAVSLPPASEEGPVGSLDVSRLQDGLLAPVFGIDDPKRDPRLHYIAGEGLRPPRVVPDETAFLLYPTTVREVIAVADAGLVMPPKSTWFEPKAWGGLFVRRFAD